MAFNQVQHVLVKLPAWRRRVLLVAILLGFLALMMRGVYLQGTHKKDVLQKEGEARYSREIILSAQRGKILDRNGDLLAGSSQVESIWASPPDVVITSEQMTQLAKMLTLKPKDIEKKLANTQKEFVYLKRRQSPELAANVMRLGVSGIFTQREYKRYYPAAEISAHIVGFTGADDKGLEGFEREKNDFLSGKTGKRRVLKDRRGRIIEDLEAVGLPQDGQDLVLSIDQRIQYLAYRELNKSVEKFKAKAGAAVVLDAKTGEVLAMVNLPTYNPNNPVNINGKARNRAITDVFEPGSTMKPITISAALNVGAINTTDKFQTAPGAMAIGSAVIHDAHVHGVLDVAGVIQKSSNIGSAKIALKLENAYLWGIFNELGFGAPTRIEFPGEVSGKLRNYKTWRPIEKATMSYGHGISVTLLQLARAYTVFANEGELRPVTLLKTNKAMVGHPVFSPDTANQMKDMLELVVQPGGTALRAQVPGYRVAGKTGTTHKLGPAGYEKDKYVGSFVGLAPASNPRLIMAVMIDEPTSGEYYGGTVAAPVFSAVMTDALRMLAVPQDAPDNNVVIPADANETLVEVEESI